MVSKGINFNGASKSRHSEHHPSGTLNALPANIIGGGRRRTIKLNHCCAAADQPTNTQQNGAKNMARPPRPLKTCVISAYDELWKRETIPMRTRLSASSRPVYPRGLGTIYHCGAAVRRALVTRHTNFGRMVDRGWVVNNTPPPPPAIKSNM